MLDLRQIEETSPRLTVFVPLVVLSAVFGGILYAVVQVSGVSNSLSPVVVLGSLFAYLAAVLLLVRIGLANIGALERVGLTDGLSGLPNRRALHQDFKALDGDNQHAALAMIDLDGFKLVNDNYGHFVGDRLIKECATLFSAAAGTEATVYRLGGDEFALLAVGPISSNILEGICRGLLVRLTRSLTIDDRVIVIGASIGLARSEPGGGLSSSELLRRTDVAMYASKRAGKMRCTWFSAEFDSLREELSELDADMRAALENDEFRVHYQPLVDASSKQVVAVEALIRWERPDGKKIGPNVFIPVAEESGLINQIGMWVLKRGFEDALDWGNIKLSVNVSAAQLRNPEFPVELGYLLEETGFPPERLELEVTETHLVLDSVIAGNSMDVIRDFGVRIVLDDFGTGYASIGFLRQFRFEKLKLDRSLVVEAASDNGIHAMMLASIAVARSLNMDVTAEGVETEAQAALVRTAGCDQIQGWLYYKAMPADELEAALIKNFDEVAVAAAQQQSAA